MAWRASIEGWPNDFVSHRGMGGFRRSDALANTVDGNNLLPAPGSVTWTGTATVTTGQADPAGGTDGALIADSDAAAAQNATPGSEVYTGGNALWLSAWIKKDPSATHTARIGVDFNAGTDAAVALNLATGAIDLVPGSGAFTSSAVYDLGGWWFVALSHPGEAGATFVTARAYGAWGTPASFPAADVTATGSVTVYGPRIADATADADGANPLRITRERLPGLNSEGFKFSESVDLVRAKWEARGLRVSVAASPAVTASFSISPTAVTYLAADTDTNDATITVLSTAAFPESGMFWIDKEAIVYTGKSATAFTGCAHGAWDTLAAYHYQSFGSRLRSPEITNQPQILEGRRVRIYAYGAGDDKQGDGTLVWIGVASTDRAFDGRRWSFSVDPLASVLNTSLGSDLEDPTTIRGIYYSGSSPLVVTVEERSGATLVSAPLVRVRFAISGFWETQREFCAALTTFMQARMTTAGSFTQTVTAEPDGASWRFSFTTAATPHWMSFEVASQVDGLPSALPDAGAGSVTTVVASTAYKVALVATESGAGLVPRTTFGPGISITQALGLPDADKSNVDPATHDVFRLYLADGAGVTSNTTACAIDWQSTGRLADESGQEPFTATVSAVDTSARSITFFRPSIINSLSGVQRYACDGTTPPEIRMGRSYGSGSLASLITSLTGQTAQYLNTGAVPDLRAADFGSLAELEAAALDGGSLTTGRGFTAFAEVKISDLIENECKLLGCYPCSDANGKITFRRLRLPSQSEVADRTLTAARVVVGDQFLAYERNALGVFNTFLLRTGYDPINDEWNGTPLKVRDVQAFGLAPVARVIECAPYSTDPGAPILIDDLVRLSSRVLGVFGGPYATLMIEVPLTSFSTLLGDVVSVTWSKVPSGDGTLGVTERLGHCVSREFEPMSAKGVLTILLTDQRVGGYAPSAKVTAIVDEDPKYELTLDDTYFPSGTTAEDFFESGDKVRLFKWNSTDTSDNVTAEIVDAVAGGVSIETGAAWNYTGATWVLGYDVSTAITAANQKRFVFLAGSDGGLDWSDETDVPPFTFA